MCRGASGTIGEDSHFDRARQVVSFPFVHVDDRQGIFDFWVRVVREIQGDFRNLFPTGTPLQKTPGPGPYPHFASHHRDECVLLFYQPRYDSIFDLHVLFRGRAEPITSGDAGLRLSVCRCSGAPRA